MSFINQYIKLFLLLFYPLLLIYHTKLLTSCKEAIVKFKELKTEKDIKSIIDNNQELKQKKAILEKEISKAYVNKDWNHIRNIIKTHV